MSNIIIIDTERWNCCSQLSPALVADPQIKAKNHFQITEFPLFWNFWQFVSFVVLKHQLFFMILLIELIAIISIELFSLGQLSLGDW